MGNAEVGVIMGSQSDWETMKHTCDVLEQLEIPYEKKVVSAHRTPDLMFRYAESAGGVPVATVAIGEAGAKNAGLLAAQILSIQDERLARKLDHMRVELEGDVIASGGNLL